MPCTPWLLRSGQCQGWHPRCCMTPSVLLCTPCWVPTCPVSPSWGLGCEPSQKGEAPLQLWEHSHGAGWVLLQCLVTLWGLRGPWAVPPWVGAESGAAGLLKPSCSRAVTAAATGCSSSTPPWKRAAGFWPVAHSLCLPRSKPWRNSALELFAKWMCQLISRLGFLLSLLKEWARSILLLVVSAEKSCSQQCLALCGLSPTLPAAVMPLQTTESL